MTNNSQRMKTKITMELGMKKLLSNLFLLLFATSVSASSKDLFITIGTDAVNDSQKSLKSAVNLAGSEEISVVKINSDDVEELSKLMHDKFNRCGGFIVHDSLEEAVEVLNANDNRAFAKNMAFVDYSINQEDIVTNFLKDVDEFEIRSTILKLSSFHNRYYKAQTGVDSQAWLKQKWESLSNGRSDISVDYYKHDRWPQPSVVMTVEGTDKSDEIVVIGGHADSIAGFWGRERARAPGADDNASGIATITEVIRVFVKNGYKPSRTIKFMAYAAEEVGLLGSNEIAKQHKRENKEVVGVLQLDMTNHKGTKDLDIVFMSDYTNARQNEFLGKLIDKYVQVPWGYSKCGYGCSDHASWHNQGFAASIPFESTMNDINGHIHTARDTIEAEGSQGTADHAEKFARLALAFLAELGK